MAFACSMHTDRTDLFDEEVRSKFLSNLLTNASNEAVMYQKYIRYSYFRTFYKVHGIGKPTTVMYHEIPGILKESKDETSTRQSLSVNSDDDGKIQQIFVHNGLSCAIPISHGDCMVFHAYTHRHGSSVAFASFDDGTIQVKNVDDLHLFAFSNSC